MKTKPIDIPSPIHQEHHPENNIEISNSSHLFQILSPISQLKSTRQQTQKQRKFIQTMRNLGMSRSCSPTTGPSVLLHTALTHPSPPPSSLSSSLHPLQKFPYYTSNSLPNMSTMNDKPPNLKQTKQTKHTHVNLSSTNLEISLMYEHMSLYFSNSSSSSEEEEDSDRTTDQKNEKDIDNAGTMKEIPLSVYQNIAYSLLCGSDDDGED